MRPAVMILFVLVLGQLAGCGGEGPANEKKVDPVTLKIHAWNGYVLEYREAFQRHAKSGYGLDVDIVFSSTSGYESNVENIRGRAKAHLVSPANDLIAPLLREGLLLRIDLKKLSNFNQINPVVLETRCHEVDGLPYAVPFNFGPYSIAYNRDKMPAPASYKVLWDRRYAKRVAIPGEYDTINIYMTALMLGMPKTDLFDLDAEQLAAVEDKLRELCRYQVGEYWRDNLDPESRERVDVGMDWGIGVNLINRKYEGNWGLAIPEEGATGWIDTWAISINATDPKVLEAAYIWIDFMISAERQAQMARITSYGPINPYAGRYLTAEEKKLYYLNYPNFMKNLILWQPLKPDVLKKYQEIWKRARQ
ncbi:MAG: ABC transporter substrate-binding protein [Thermodesulfobacteriota bacterium]